VTLPPFARDTRHWSMFVLLIPFQFIFGLIYAWSAIAPAIHQQENSWSYAQLDLAFGLTPLSLLPAVIWGGRLAERYPSKYLLAAANVCFCLGGLIGLTAQGPTTFLLGYSVLALGVGAGLSTPACMAAIAREYPEHRGKLSGALLAVYGLSAMITAPLFQQLLTTLTWREALAVITSAYAIIGWLAWWALPAEGAVTGPAAVRNEATDAQRAHRGPVEYRSLLLNLCLILAAAPFGAVSFAGLGRLLPQTGFSGQTVLLLISGMALANGVGRFMGGMLADTLPEKMDKMLIFLINALAFLNLSLTNRLHWQQGMMLYPLLVGLAYGALAGNLPAIARLIAPQRPHAVFGMLFGTFALGSFLGPLISALAGLEATLEGFGWLSCLAALVALGEWHLQPQRARDVPV
jgi:MFS transporter, OFA family, oxalate/formate antiporter